MHDRLAETADAVAAAGVRTVTVTADVADQDSVRAMVRDTVAALGSLDVMVANAGISQTTPLLDLTVEELDRVHAVNVRGTFLCYTEAARQMIAQDSGGKVIGAGSIAAYRGFPYSGAYCASKFGVRALTQVAAQEWAPHGITVNAYCPGVVDTEMWVQIDGALSALTGAPAHQPMQEMVDDIALGRAATGEDVARLVSFLAGPDSDYVTGQSILVDGGMLFG
jgi:meso-butanediol dehydrogenase/(S,S)-butanediol dehydrogenase/diacetyl reductase